VTNEQQAIIEQLRERRVFMMFHTHWDREWYATTTISQHRAVDLMERVFEVFGGDSPYPAFFLDGQTCLLDDYLSLCKHKRDQLHDMISRGRIHVGPWYVMPEEHQPSAESHIRNLEIGLRIAKELGNQGKPIGYLGDPVTYIPQMPQILKKFGIESMTQFRGISPMREKAPQEMIAVAPDGSEVFFFFTAWSYYMDFGTTYEDFLERLCTFAAPLIPSSTSGNILLMSGGDQMLPTGKEMEFLERLERETGVSITLTTFADYVDMLRESCQVQARIEKEGLTTILRDIFSARIPLKRRIKTCERKLERIAEPLVTLAALCGADPQIELIHELWRRNTENMFHDSIYCAHSDEVCRDIEHRCDHLEALTERVARIAFYNLKRLEPSWSEPAAQFTEPHALLNTTGVTIEGFCEVEVYCDSPGNRVFSDANGTQIPAMLLAERTEHCLLSERFVDDGLVQPTQEKTWQKYLMLLPKLPPASPFLLNACRAACNEPTENAMSGFQGRVWRLGIKEGRLILYWYGMERSLRFQLEEDRGDLYTFQPTGEHEELLCNDPQWSINSGFFLLTFRLLSTLRHVSVDVHVTMHEQCDEIRFRFRFANEDKGFRVIMEMDEILSNGRHTAHTPYAVAKREYTDYDAMDPALRSASLPEGYRVHYPFVEFFGVNTDKAGLSFFSPDITTYHLDARNNMWITLLRSVSYLSLPDLSERPTMAGPRIATPLAELQGESAFEMTLVPKALTPEEQMRVAWGHNFPIPCYPLAIKERSGVTRPTTDLIPEHRRKKGLPRTAISFPFIDVDSGDVLIGAFRCIGRSREDVQVVARVVNLSDEERSARLATGFEFRSVVLTDLNHRPLRDLSAEGREVPLTLKPGEIATLLFSV